MRDPTENELFRGMELPEVVSVLISIASLSLGQVTGVALLPLMSQVYISHKANGALIKLLCCSYIAGLCINFLQAALESFNLSLFFWFSPHVFFFTGAGKRPEISLDKRQQLEGTGFSMERRNFIRGAIV